MTLILLSEVKALFYLTTKTDVITTYNSAEGLTTTMTIAKDTILSKFTTVSAAPVQLNTLVIGELNNMGT